jgi:integrase
MKIKHIKMNTGERLPMLLVDNVIPHFWATLYVSILIRAKAQNTIEHSLNTIRYLHAWEDYHGRDFSQEFRMGHFLTDGDIQSLADHCAYTVEAFKKWTTRDKRRRDSRRTVSEANLLALKVSAPLKTVQLDSQYNRITTVASYLKFVAETVCRVRADKREIQAQIKRMYEGLLSKRPKSNASKSRGRYAHIFAESCRRFAEIARPDHADNPFRVGESRNRNYLMVKIAYELGLRAGEILGLWVGDIDSGPKPTITVVRRHNHPLDPRAKQCVAKTAERILPISQELASSLHRYIIYERSKHSYANKHPILFVTSQGPWRGHALSCKSFGKGFKLIEQVDPDQLADISPHAFRHDRACRFVDEIEAINHASKTNKKIKPITDGECLGADPRRD